MSNTRPKQISHRNAVERQLLAEEKWLVNAINEIRKGRNALQIERLHLESLKARDNLSADKKTSERTNDVVAHQRPTQTPSHVDLTPKTSTLPVGDVQIPIRSQPLIEFEIYPNDEIICNNEELNLGVSAQNAGDSFLGNVQAPELEYEEYDDESDDGNNVLIDMNMFMNGNASDTE